MAFWFCFVFKKVDENHFPKLIAKTIQRCNNHSRYNNQKQDSNLIQEIFLRSFLFYEYIYNRCIILHYPGLKVTGWGIFFFQNSLKRKIKIRMKELQHSQTIHLETLLKLLLKCASVCVCALSHTAKASPKIFSI